MKLYFATGACSLSPHIILRELGLPFELVKVDNKTKKTANGDDFLKINPKGYVAALELDNGQILTEGPAIVQYLADLKPESKLAPANGTWERVRLQELLSFLSSEIHSGLGPLFNTSIPDDVKQIFKDKLFKRFNYLEEILAKQDYLLGAQFSVADPYLFTLLRWTPLFAIDLKQWPAITTFMERIGSRTEVKAAIEAEKAS